MEAGHSQPRKARPPLTFRTTEERVNSDVFNDFRLLMFISSEANLVEDQFQPF